jgi:hypothetical protein
VHLCLIFHVNQRLLDRYKWKLNFLNLHYRLRYHISLEFCNFQVRYIVTYKHNFPGMYSFIASCAWMNTEINGVKTLGTGCTTQISLVISPQPGFVLLFLSVSTNGCRTSRFIGTTWFIRPNCCVRGCVYKFDVAKIMILHSKGTNICTNFWMDDNIQIKKKNTHNDCGLFTHLCVIISTKT